MDYIHKLKSINDSMLKLKVMIKDLKRLKADKTTILISQKGSPAYFRSMLPGLNKETIEFLIDKLESDVTKLEVEAENL